MANRHRMTRAELNEKAWELKKVKKKKGLARGTRSNPNIVEVAIDTVQSKGINSTTPKSPKVVRAIPLNIPGREQPLVSEKVVQQALQVQEQQTKEVKDSSSTKSVDLVVKDGQLVNAFAPKTKARKNKVAKSNLVDEKASPKTSKSIKLGKAALKRLERESVGFGEEFEYFENYAKEKVARKTKQKVKAQEQSEFEKDLNTSNRILSRDYKAGRNTDYTRSQANAEKVLRAKKSNKPAKRSGEELLDLWDSMK